MTDSPPQAQNPQPESDPKLRHEFVGMMFAVAIGEVGLQTAALVRAGHWVHFLPAYSHLVLATVVVATSWVGWTLSVAPGARRDVKGIFQWEFLVLLLDVFLVIVYFILVRTVDFAAETTAPFIAPASTVASWILFIFFLYLAWDLLTEVIIYFSKEKHDGHWLNTCGVRMLPTLLCLFLAYVIKRLIGTVDPPYLVTADFALLSLVLLFRVLKEFVSALFPAQPLSSKQPGVRKRPAVVWTVLCALGIALGTLWTMYSWPLPGRMVTAIETQPSKEGNLSKTPVSTRLPQRFGQGGHQTRHSVPCLQRTARDG